MTEKSKEKTKSGAGKFVLGAILGAAAGALAGHAISSKAKKNSCDEDCNCGYDFDEEDDDIKSTEDNKAKSTEAKKSTTQPKASTKADSTDKKKTASK